MNAKGIKIECHDHNVLTISGERSSEKRDEDSGHYERYLGRFSRSFRLDNHMDVQNMQAKLDSGVLSVIIPKHQQDAVPSSVRNIPIQAAEESSDDPREESKD